VVVDDEKTRVEGRRRGCLGLLIHTWNHGGDGLGQLDLRLEHDQISFGVFPETVGSMSHHARAERWRMSARPRRLRFRFSCNSDDGEDVVAMYDLLDCVSAAEARVRTPMEFHTSPRTGWHYFLASDLCCRFIVGRRRLGGLVPGSGYKEDGWREFAFSELLWAVVRCWAWRWDICTVASRGSSAIGRRGEF